MTLMSEGAFERFEGLKMQMQDMLFNLQVREDLNANYLTVDDLDQCDLDQRITQDRLAGCKPDEAAFNIAVVFEAR